MAARRMHFRAKSPLGVALVIFLLTTFFTTYTWLWSGSAWLHIELLGTAEYIWRHPHCEDNFQRLIKVFDWRAFDPIASRARPLNDLAEVIDAIARPYLVESFGPHPSLTPVAVLTAVLTPLFMLLCLRRCLGSWPAALLLGALFLSSPGFLSCIIPYIRPAKKLTLLFTCSSLYFIKRFEDSGRSNWFLAFWLSMFTCLFCDEQALSHYLLLAFIFFPGWNWGERNRHILMYLAMPACYLAVLKWALPCLYDEFGTGARWDTFANSQKYRMLLRIFNGNYWATALKQAACAVLSNVGITDHSLLLQILAILVVLGVPLAVMVRRGKRSLRAVWQNPLARCTLALLAASFWSSLLYQFNEPDLATALGSLASFSYYYHSSLSIFIVLWFALLWREFLQAFPTKKAANCGPRLVMPVGCLIIVANFMLFYCVNDLLQIMHTYPYSAATMNETLAAQAARRQVHGSYMNEFHFVNEKSHLRERFETTGRRAFGDRWQDTFFYRSFHGTVVPQAATGQSYPAKLTRSFFPLSRW